MLLTAGEPLLVESVEISGIKGENRPSFGYGVLQLLFIGEALFLDFVGADSVVAL